MFCIQGVLFKEKCLSLEKKKTILTEISTFGSNLKNMCNLKCSEFEQNNV